MGSMVYRHQITFISNPKMCRYQGKRNVRTIERERERRRRRQTCYVESNNRSAKRLPEHHENEKNLGYNQQNWGGWLLSFQTNNLVVLSRRVQSCFLERSNRKFRSVISSNLTFHKSCKHMFQINHKFR